MSVHQSVVVNQRLPAFAQPDTQTRRIGFINPGEYRLVDYQENFPDSDTNYARIVIPALRYEQPWICTRWKKVTYGAVGIASRRILDSAIDIALSGQLAGRVIGADTDSSVQDDATTVQPVVTEVEVAAGVTEKQLLTTLRDYWRFRYEPDDARYPQQLPNLNLRIAPPWINNCCTFVEGLLVATWANHVPGFHWNRDRHARMMITSNRDYFSPVTAAVESGIAINNDADSSPAPWSIVQGWRQQWRGGHTFIIVDHDPGSDRVLTLESNSAYKLDGVGFRAIGNLRDFDGEPPHRWWEKEGLWTWTRIKSIYQYRAKAALKVRDCNWSGRIRLCGAGNNNDNLDEP